MTAISANPIWVGEFDLANPPAALIGGAVDPDGKPYRRARLQIRFRGEPLGMILCAAADGEVDSGAVRDEAFDRFRSAIAELAGPGWGLDSPATERLSPELAALAERQDLPAVSVVIGTRNRPDHVVACIGRVLKQQYPSPIEVIVVDNGADDSATADLIAATFGQDDRVVYLSESRPGLSRARNIGLSAARYPITAFLSDDIRVDQLWLLTMARGFRRDAEVRCVTGVCPPLFLDSPEQLMFESAMGWGTRQGFEAELFGFDSADDPLHPYRVGSFANGSNMAYHTETFRRLGGFDEALGPGTRARGGEDLDAPVRILASGGLVAHEPAMVGWHADRYDDRPFHRHLYTYGIGLTAFLTKHLMDRKLRGAVLRRVTAGLQPMIQGFERTDETFRQEVPIPTRYHAWHLAGRVVGPFAYLRSRLAWRR